MASAGSFRRRRLGRELRRLRDERNLRLDDVAPEVDITPATLSRIELAQVEIKPNTVRALVSHYEVDVEQAEALINLAREAKAQSWWHVYGDVLPTWFEVYVDLEGEAETIDVYESTVITGLLQTEDYARALLTAAFPEDAPEEIERRVELRMQRQARLVSGELRLRVILDEYALLRPYGNPAMLPAQIDHLLDSARLRNTLIQILPAASPLSTASPFAILQFTANDPTVVYLENEIGALYLEKSEQVRPYSLLYERLRAAALSPEASIAHLAQLSKE